MQPYIVLLRGVMPTGKNKVHMATLRSVLRDEGFEQVATYIASGNVLLHSSLALPEVEKQVADIISKRIGPKLAVIARTPEQFSQAWDESPFPTVKDHQTYFTFLADLPDQGAARQFSAQDFAPEQVQLHGDVIYTCYATKYSDSRINNSFFERQLGVPATTRRFTTVARLLQLVTQEQDAD